MANHTKEENRIRVVCRGGEEGRLDIRGLKPMELDKLEASITNGTYFINFTKGGRLIAVEKFADLPSPETDNELLPYWRKLPEQSIQCKLFKTDFDTSIDKDDINATSYFSIHIQHLCGYNYTKVYYRSEAKKLTEYGFECLRSKRGIDGRFSEIWSLSSTILAKGELENFLKESEKNKSINSVVGWLCKNVSFGSLDVSTQRAAMSID